MNIAKYSDRVHMARTQELASASPPYERVPNILRYSFSNLFIIYTLISNGGISNAYSWHLQAWSTFNLATVYVKSIVSNDRLTYYYTRKAPPFAEMLTNFNARKVTLHLQS